MVNYCGIFITLAPGVDGTKLVFFVNDEEAE
jgi:hypothetical protein